MAYFYCDFRNEDKQNCSSIISQLCAQSNFCCNVLSRIYLTHDNSAQKPSDETLTGRNGLTSSRGPHLPHRGRA